MSFWACNATAVQSTSVGRTSINTARIKLVKTNSRPRAGRFAEVVEGGSSGDDGDWYGFTGCCGCDLLC